MNKKGGGARTLYDVTQLLESADQADARMRRVLELLRDLVPYEQCAMLEARLGHDPRVVLVPEPPPEARAVLARDAGRPLRAARRPGRAHARGLGVRGGAPRRAARGARRGDRHLAGAVVGDGIQRGAPARAVGDRGEARRLHHDPGRERRSRGPRPRARRGTARRRGGPRREGRIAGARFSRAQDARSPERKTASSSTRSRRRPSGSTSCSARRASRPRSCA